MIRGYDQWKTASPYDDQVDWAEYGIDCPECECDAPEEQDCDGDTVEFWCPDCGHQFKIPLENLNKQA